MTAPLSPDPADVTDGDYRVLLERRIRSKVGVDSAGCWIWQGSRYSNGYARVSVHHAMQLAHRVTYQLIVGPIPDGLQLDHLCRVRHCVNPAHLEAVTASENTRRSTSSAAVNARKTHCASGHPYTPENTRISKGRKRSCRSCDRARARRRYYAVAAALGETGGGQ